MRAGVVVWVPLLQLKLLAVCQGLQLKRSTSIVGVGCMPRSPVEASVVGPAMGDIIGGEHRVRIAANSGGRAGAGKVAAPEKWVNCFVRVVALMERTGNALGTLAFTWATVILLGGYPTVLGSKNDYWFTTIIVFLEAARMFSSNRSDYQLFFRTRGAFRSLGGKGLIVIVCFWGATFSIIVSPAATTLLIAIIIIMVLLAVVQFLCPRGARRPQTYYKWLCTAVSLWSPVVAILLLASPIYHNRGMNGIIPRNPLAMRLVYVVLVVVVLLATVSRLQFPIIINLVQGALGSKQVQLFWHRVVRKLCMLAAVVMLLFMVDQQLKAMMIVLDICAITILSFGNLQIPAALLRVVLAFLRLLGPLPHEYKGDDDSRINLVPSLTIFYGMVLGQGILYIVAGILEVFSFIPRRSLVRNGGFTGQWGVESVKLYYAYAFDKNMEGGVFASKRISLSNFAVDSINSDLSKDQLYGIRMMHLFLQRDPTRAELQEKLTSTQTMARLISMLDWTSRNDHTTIRTYAAKVTAELAKSLRIVTVPGAMQLVSTLLDADGKPKRAHPLLVADDDQDPFVDTTERREKRPDAAGDQGQRQELVGDIDNMLATPTRSTHVNNQRSILRSCQRISEYWSIPKEQALTDDDLLPALGMSIVYNLASCDQNNCVEIDRVTDLIPKIIGFTSFRSAMVNSEAQQKVLVKTLQVLQKLTSIEGEIGITLRYKISKHPFLLRNLAEIMGDNSSTQELRKLVAEILRNLAIDRDTRQEIGHMQVLITRLIKAFLNSDRPSSANADCLLPKIAGQALAMLASENVHNCLVMLKEPEFINKLKNAIHDNKYIYVAASLLRNLCMHAQPELMESGLKELSHTLQKVLDRIMDVEGAELEILIGLSSQICKVNPEEFAQELEHGQIKRRFVKRLVDALNANMKPSVHCPGIRRVILEQSIYMMECNSHYANCFNEFQMMDALSMVEETPSRAENYMIFLGDTGFMECSTPLFVLVDRAKQLIGRQWLQGINNAS